MYEEKAARAAVDKLTIASRLAMAAASSATFCPFVPFLPSGIYGFPSRLSDFKEWLNF